MVLFDKFGIPRMYEGDSFQYVIYYCNTRKKCPAEHHGMSFDDAVKCITEILQHPIVIGCNVNQYLDALEIPHTMPGCVYDTAECEAL